MEIWVTKWTPPKIPHHTEQKVDLLSESAIDRISAITTIFSTRHNTYITYQHISQHHTNSCHHNKPPYLGHNNTNPHIQSNNEKFSASNRYPLCFTGSAFPNLHVPLYLISNHRSPRDMWLNSLMLHNPTLLFLHIACQEMIGCVVSSGNQRIVKLEPQPVATERKYRK